MELGLALDVAGVDGAVGYNLVNDPEFLLRYQAVALARFHNHFGQMDGYMKEFTRICVETGDQNVLRNLERLLNVEVSVMQEQSADKLLPNSDKHETEVDPIILAQPQFKFSAVADKLKMIESYKSLIKDQDRTREAMQLLQRATDDPAVFSRLTKDFKQVFSLVEELDNNQFSNLKFTDSFG